MAEVEEEVAAEEDNSGRGGKGDLGKEIWELWIGLERGIRFSYEGNAGGGVHLKKVCWG